MLQSFEHNADIYISNNLVLEAGGTYPLHIVVEHPIFLQLLLEFNNALWMKFANKISTWTRINNNFELLFILQYDNFELLVVELVPF